MVLLCMNRLAKNVRLLMAIFRIFAMFLSYVREVHLRFNFINVIVQEAKLVQIGLKNKEILTV